MGVDIGIYCTVDEEALKDKRTGKSYCPEYWEVLDGDPLLSVDRLTPWKDWRGHRVHKLPNWIGELLWILEEVREGEHQEIKKVYVRDDCDGAMLEATPDNVVMMVKMFCDGKFFSIFDCDGSFK